MQKTPIVTISFFSYQGWLDQWWAFKQMGIAPFRLGGVKGMQTFKMLGSGGENGFSIRPNFAVYALLVTWEEEAVARSFFKEHPVFVAFQKRAEETWTVFLHATMSHGQWSGEEPFTVTKSFDEDELVGVITRARIKTSHLVPFWKAVPTVSESIENREGLLFSMGIGEWPIIQQATFSLWQNSKLMKAYAYRSKFHKEVIMKTRKLGWYKEELFARFIPYDTEGTWQGKQLLKDFFKQDDTEKDSSV